MNCLRRAPVLMFGLLLLACDGLTAPEGPATGISSLNRAGSSRSGCYPVSFQDVGSAGNDPFTALGVLSGDLKGSFVVHFDPTSVKITRAVARVGGTIDWTITGGVLPGPFPLTFTGIFRQINLLLDTPVSPETLVEQVGTFRATRGVARANLHFRGTFDGTTGTAIHYWRGVICP